MSKTIRQIAREKATFAVYQHLLLDNSLEDMMLYIKEDEQLKEGYSAYKLAVNIITHVYNNKDSYIILISKYLKKSWTFDRLPLLEQAILLVAVSELLETDTDKRVVINEAIENAKMYCEDHSYKYINGVLNKI